MIRKNAWKNYLIESMKQIPRIHVERVEIDEMGLKEEDSFEIAN